MKTVRYTMTVAAAVTLLGTGAAFARSASGEVREIDEAAGKITIKHRGSRPSI